jgi:hypothetical protein
VSEVCNGAEIQPSVFYKWEKELIEAAPSLFATRRAPSREQELLQRIAGLRSSSERSLLDSPNCRTPTSTSL